MGHLGDRHIATTNYGLCRRFRARHHEQFARYVDRVTNVFGQYTTDILAMIEEGNRVSGKMRFHGYHQQKIFGVKPSGRHVWWIGMPIFTFDGPKVRDLYVLGDIYGLIVRLKDEAESGL
jgi:predicted ester cyclase